MTWAYIHLEPHMHTDCPSNNKQTHRGLIVFSIWRASPVSLSLRYQANSSVARMSFILLTGTSLSDSQAAQQQGILYLILLSHQLHTTAIHYTKHAVAWHIIYTKKCHFLSNISFYIFSNHIFSFCSVSCCFALCTGSDFVPFLQVSLIHCMHKHWCI